MKYADPRQARRAREEARAVRAGQRENVCVAAHSFRDRRNPVSEVAGVRQDRDENSALATRITHAAREFGVSGF